MWPNTDEERDWLDGKTGKLTSLELPTLDPAVVAYYVAEGRRLRSEAAAAIAHRMFRAMARGIGRMTGASAPDAAAPDDPASTVAHRLRTPLTAIRALSEMLRENPDVPLAQRKRFLDAIVEESDRLNRTINEVVDSIRTNSERLAEHCKPRAPTRA